jgi:hypothetical protein
MIQKKENNRVFKAVLIFFILTCVYEPILFLDYQYVYTGRILNTGRGVRGSRVYVYSYRVKNKIYTGFESQVGCLEKSEAEFKKLKNLKIKISSIKYSTSDLVDDRVIDKNWSYWDQYR